MVNSTTQSESCCCLGGNPTGGKPYPERNPRSASSIAQRRGGGGREMLCVYSQGRNHTHNTRHHVRNAAHARSSDPQTKETNGPGSVGRSAGKHDGMRCPSRQTTHSSCWTPGPSRAADARLLGTRAKRYTFGGAPMKATLTAHQMLLSGTVRTRCKRSKRAVTTTFAPCQMCPA